MYYSRDKSRLWISYPVCQIVNVFSLPILYDATRTNITVFLNPNWVRIIELRVVSYAFVETFSILLKRAINSVGKNPNKSVRVPRTTRITINGKQPTSPRGKRIDFGPKPKDRARYWIRKRNQHRSVADFGKGRHFFSLY